jgi:hypothetical protein
VKDEWRALQRTTNIMGPWNDISGATSPWIVAANGPQQFY